MSREEKELRWRELRKKVREDDLPSWAEEFLDDLERSHGTHYRQSKPLFSSSR